MAKFPDRYSNDPINPDAELRKLTPHEVKVADLADKAKDVVPQHYNITSKNTKALRVVHDHDGRSVAIPPGETKRGVMLRPDIAEYLGKGDLEVVAA